jgi:hypothetical protein
MCSAYTELVPLKKLSWVLVFSRTLELVNMPKLLPINIVLGANAA